MARYPIISGAGGHNEFLRSSKIISRQSSVSFSSRIYYRSSGAAGFPFTWEMLPGEPKEKRVCDGDIPPLSPPPALQSLSLPKPSVEDYFENKKASTPSKLLLKLWKNMGKRMNKKSQSKALNVTEKCHLDYINQKSDICFDLDTKEDYEFGSSADSSSFSPPLRKAMSSSSCSFSQCSSSLSTTEDKRNNVGGADQEGTGRNHFAPSYWTIKRMVVACTSGPKNIY